MARDHSPSTPLRLTARVTQGGVRFDEADVVPEWYTGAMAFSDDELEELKEIFDHYDSDGNGVIDREELRRLLVALDPEFTEEDVQLGLQALDGNENGVIDWDEFIEWWGKR
tara:strand:+ start:1024 stop:1359 length:336 start_codon:yes stop_codon:yes gene_type:complete